MGYLILFGWLILLPICVGGFLADSQNKQSLSAQWLWGQFMLWAFFQPVATWYILKKETLESIIRVYKPLAVVLGIMGLLTALIMWIKRDKSLRKRDCLWIKDHKIQISIFLMLWLVQMTALLFLAVNDGDDAFYMAVAKKAEEAGTLYTTDVYSYGYTELNYRYALAPFPIWIAFLSKLSGVHTLTIGHVVLGVTMITMSYVVYGQMGQVLFGKDKKKQLQLLILVAIVYIWGNTSSHTAESFLLLRTRQGKALVAGLVFPTMIYLLLRVGKELEEKGKVPLKIYIMAAMTILTGCLGSTLGGALVILLWASALFLLAVGYKKCAMLFLGALSAMPGLVYALLYLMN